MTHDALHADAVHLLSSWRPPEQAARQWQETVDLLGRGPQVMARAQDGHITASAIVVSHDGARALLCLHGKYNVWLQLGGHCEPGDESLASVALREATEESGIAGLTIDPDPVDVSVHDAVCNSAPSWHYDVIFVVRAPSGVAERVSEESHELGWFGWDDLPSPLGTDAARVLRSARARLAAA